MNSFGYSCIPENKIITSFKRFLEEKKKNSFPSPNDIATGLAPGEDFIEHTPSKETITYQAQVISCYYSLDDEQQDQFWKSMEATLTQELSALQGEDFYIRILQEITKFFGIQRDSIQLQPFLEKKIVYAYNDCGYRIYMEQILRFDEEQHVGIGIMTKDLPIGCGQESGKQERWVIKWNTTPENGEKITLEEMDKWRLIESTGANIPKLLSGFMILDFSVVVMERLYPLESQDYNQKLVMSITSFIEKLIPIGVNNNLKPSNIMKRIYPLDSSKSKEITYLVSDIGSMTIEPLLYGYRRFTWSPFWSSQVKDSDTVTTVKNDLLEFGYVLTWLSLMSDISDEEELLSLMNSIRTIEKPKEILDWMNRVRMINEQNIEMKDFLDLKKLGFAFPKFNTYESLVFDYCRTESQ